MKKITDNQSEKVVLANKDGSENDNSLTITNSTLETQEDSDLESSDHVVTYDDTERSNISLNNPISESNEKTNENSANERPTFNRTYDKNASDETEVDSSDV